MHRVMIEEYLGAGADWNRSSLQQANEGTDGHNFDRLIRTIDKISQGFQNRNEDLIFNVRNVRQLNHEFLND